MSEVSYARRRFPVVVIQHAVWLYFRFSLCYGDIEDLLAERGIDVSTRHSADGCSNSVRLTRRDFAAAGLGQARHRYMRRPPIETTISSAPDIRWSGP